MRLFAVRLIKDKQAVGFFWAPDPITLWWMIDSVCDPGECEYHRINDRAALTWEGKVKATLGTGAKTDEATGECAALNELRTKMTFEYALEDYVIGEVDSGWTKVPYADEPGGGIHEIFTREEKKKGRATRTERKNK
jgi:hypothetical protein